MQEQTKASKALVPAALNLRPPATPFNAAAALPNVPQLNA
jgi:hypothetical protein